VDGTAGITQRSLRGWCPSSRDKCQRKLRDSGPCVVKNKPYGRSNDLLCMAQGQRSGIDSDISSHRRPHSAAWKYFPHLGPADQNAIFLRHRGLSPVEVGVEMCVLSAHTLRSDVQVCICCAYRLQYLRDMMSRYSGHPIWQSVVVECEDDHDIDCSPARD